MSSTASTRKRIIILAITAFLLAVVFVILPNPGKAEAGDYQIFVNREQNVMTIYAPDAYGNYTIPVRAMVCATGKNYSSPAGWSQISQKEYWHQLNGGVWGQYCSRYGTYEQHVLIHSVYYYAAYDKGSMTERRYNMLGTQASDGCINLTVLDAKWVFDNCPSGTWVYVYDSPDPGPLGKPSHVMLDADRNWGWDPTDPDPANPYYTNMYGFGFNVAEGKNIAVGATENLPIQFYTSGDVSWYSKVLHYSSSNYGVATVDDYGNVTGLSPGTAWITAYNLNETMSARYLITIGTPVDSVSASAPSPMIVRQQAAATATVLPTNASDKSVTWSSSDTSVATVDSYGTITGVSAGTATITATSKASASSGGVSKSGSCTVTVVAPKVVYLDNDGQVLSIQNIGYNERLEYPEVGDKQGDDGTLEFAGWDKHYDIGSWTLTCVAKYEKASTVPEPVAPAEADNAEAANDVGSAVTADSASATTSDNVGSTVTNDDAGSAVVGDDSATTVTDGDAASATTSDDSASSMATDATTSTTTNEDTASATTTDATSAQPQATSSTEGSSSVEQPIVPQGSTPTVVMNTLSDKRYDFAGQNRFMTSYLAILSCYQTAGCAIISSGEKPYDALASSGLSAFDQSPVILTESQNLNWFSYWTLACLDTTQVTITGGTGAVSSSEEATVLQTLQANCDKGETASVVRISGGDRVGTANQIALSKSGQWSTTAVLASSNSAYDASCAAPYSAADKVPILLVDSSGNITDETMQILADGGFTRVVIAGGTAAVSQATQDRIAASGIEVVRVGGADRYATSAAMAEWIANDSSNLSWKYVAVATGGGFADVLVGAPIQGHLGGVIVLASDDANGTPFLDTYKASNVSTTLFYGGQAALPNDLRTKIMG